MTHQQKFDRLRRDCSTTLAQFITAAHETERQMQSLQLLVGADENLKFLSLRRAEFDACYAYVMASNQLTGFLHQKLQPIQ
jgi:hypothetical protein